MPTQKRIGYVLEGEAMGGAERSTTILIRGLDRAAFTPVLLCPDAPELEPLRRDVGASGAEVVPLAVLSPAQRGLPFRVRIAILRRAFAPLKLDILHIQLRGGIGARDLIIAARMAGIRRVFVTIRGAHLEPLPPRQRTLTRIVDRLVTRYTVASEDNRRLQIANVGRRPEQVLVIYNAIETGRFDPAAHSRSEARASLPVPADGPLIGTIGRMDPFHQKGIGTFIEAAQIVRETVPDARFVIVGEGEEEANYRRKVETTGLTETVFFAGYRTDVASCLAAMDIFALASTFEPFGLVLAEAMCMEKPTVATRVGGIPEVVADGETGLIVPPRDPHALAKALLAYLTDQERAHAAGQAGRKRVLERFTQSRLSAEFANLYHGH